MQESVVHDTHGVMVLYVHEASLKKNMENKFAILWSAQIPPRYGTHMHKYHQVIGLKCTKTHEDELSKYVHRQKIEWSD